MGKPRKHRFPTWTDAEINEEVARKSLNVHEIALRELVRGKVTWIQSEEVNSRRIGVCALKEAHGGVVIIHEREHLAPYYVDEWCNRIRQLSAPITSRKHMPGYKAWLDSQKLADKVKSLQMEASNELWRERHSPAVGPSAPLVDHIPRPL